MHTLTSFMLRCISEEGREGLGSFSRAVATKAKGNQKDPEMEFEKRKMKNQKQDLGDTNAWEEEEEVRRNRKGVVRKKLCYLMGLTGKMLRENTFV